MVNESDILKQIARRAMLERGLQPDFPPAALAQLADLRDARAASAQEDLRSLPWSSIDNDESRDLDQIEVCIAEGSVTRVLVGIADVAHLVPRGSPIDEHAQTNTTSVYTPAEIFPMLPTELSTDRTSLNDGQDRAAIVMEMHVDAGGAVTAERVYPAMVRNKAKLAYDSVSAWLEGGAAPDAIARDAAIGEQVRMQDLAAQALRHHREADGALDFDRRELKPVVEHGRVTDLQADAGNRARDIIENFMVAANGVTARFLSAKGVPAMRRIVRSPERWARIVALAAQHGGSLPHEADAMALAAFLKQQRTASPDTFPDLSLAIIKLLGRGEYVAMTADGPAAGHFALAVSSYTHSTAPNRRFPDLVTQRQLKAVFGATPPAYDLPTLTALAQHCTDREDAANKIERLVRKAAAALWLQHRIGQTFDAIVTGAAEKGTWVRITHPPVEGRVVRGESGLDVGDRIRVRLVHVDPGRGYIDFARA